MEWGQPSEKDSSGKLEDGLHSKEERGTWFAEVFYPQQSSIV